MSIADIPLDKAELLSVLLESLLYGFSLLMFGATIWTLSSQRSTHHMNRGMFMVAWALLFCSTAHIIIDIIRAMEGLILYRDTYHGGPIAYFSDVSQWTFVSKNYAYIAQTLIGDGVVLYRCYVVWQSKLVMIAPVLLWCAAAVTGLLICHVASKVTQSGVFVGVLSRLITAFWATALATNLLTTLLLLCRIWHLDRKATKLFCQRQSQLRPILHILIDAGAIYSLTLLIALICFAIQTNGQCVVLNMVTPIISITFYMVILRVGLATQTERTSTGQNGGAERRRRMHVHVTTLTQSILDDGDRSPASLTSARKSPANMINSDGVGGVTY